MPTLADILAAAAHRPGLPLTPMTRTWSGELNNRGLHRWPDDPTPYEHGHNRRVDPLELTSVRHLPRPRPPHPTHTGTGGTPTTPTTPGTTPTTPTTPPAATLPNTREGWMQLASQQFTPGYEVGAVPSSLLDDTINSIIGEQKNAALDYLNRGQARGIYNDVGYGAGLSALGTDAAMGRSDLSSLGSTVIDKYRGALDKVGDDAFTAASSYQPGYSFSLDPYTTRRNEVLGRANTNAGGDLRNLLGGRNYFDFSNLSGKVGQAQGALNLRDTDIATALAERKRQNVASRGLGSQGAF